MDPTIDYFDGRISPGEVLRIFMESEAWSQELLALITGRSRGSIAQILADRTGITPETAVVFAAAFGNSPNDWLRLEANYRLGRIKGETAEVERRARIYGIVPVKDIQRRGWIGEPKSLDALEGELRKFLGVESLDDAPPFLVSTRRSTASLTPSQIAWCARARQMAAAIVTDRFSAAKLPRVEREVRVLAAYPKEARHLPRILAKFGIRLVIVEPLPGGKIDGAAFWLNEQAPVIALSLRYDRMDAFWYTVMHELSHIAHQDSLSVDTDLSEPAFAALDDECEERANREASAALVPTAELESFIRRVGPLYSRQRVIQFAHAIKIHPGIIVGQLQHRGEVGYSALRNLLVKIRNIVTETALTDGWGKTISPGLL